MAWIEVIGEDDARGTLAEYYRKMRDRTTGAVDNILKIHSLHPATLRNHYDLYRTVMYGRGGLSRIQREMIAVVASVINRCRY